ncbi:MAG: STAS domain-containing protein [Oscillospiraceae bacterium]|nr:STAS domain-containing protein [Oscillospiraceae bacterium]
MRLTSFLQDGKLTVILTGEIDHHCAKEYMSAIAAKIEAYVPQVCCLDFRDVSFMDSSGIAIVINAMRAMTHIDGKVIISGPKEQPMKVFKASGVNRLIEIQEVI